MDPAEIREAIRRLPKSERALLRPWVLARFDVRGYDRDQQGWNPDSREGTVLATAISHLESAQRQLHEVMQNVGLEDRPVTTIELLGVVDASSSAVHALLLLCENARAWPP
jgi:hypothetical protein